MKLAIEKVSVGIKDLTIVKNVSLHVEGKKFVGILGPNGSGKSTLLKAIYQVNKASAGRMTLGHLDLVKEKSKNVAKYLGTVAQFNELQFDFTVEQMVFMGRAPHKKLLEKDQESDYEIVQSALQAVNLESYRERSFLSLSGGEKQRVVLARVLAQQPHFLILDEPTNHLDVKYQVEILKKVKSLQIGTLAALHDLTLAATYCDYIYLMKAGQVVVHGEPLEVLTKAYIEEVFDVSCEVYKNPVNGKVGVVFL